MAKKSRLIGCFVTKWTMNTVFCASQHFRWSVYKKAVKMEVEQR